MMRTMRRYLAPAVLLATIATVSTFATAARGQGVAFGPVIGQFNDGAMMGVTPVASADRRYVRMSGGVAFTGLQGMDVINVPGAVAGGGGGFVPGGFRQMAPGGGVGNVGGNNGFVAGGVATPSASGFAFEPIVPGGWYRGYPGMSPYGYGYGPAAGPLLYNAPFGGFGPAPGYGTVNGLVPLGNSIRYGAGRRR
jgi:hypothetical protein